MLRIINDMLMSLLWITTYTLVLIGTKRYKYPLIPPLAQIVIVSYELSVITKIVISGAAVQSYIWIANLFWAGLDLAIFAVQIKDGYIPRKYAGLTVITIIIATLLMCYPVIYKGHQLFFSYFNTFVGEVFWLIHICKKNYPLKPIVLAFLLTKFAADVIGATVYFGVGSWAVSLISILLPVLDFLFIHVYFKRKTESITN